MPFWCTTPTVANIMGVSWRAEGLVIPCSSLGLIDTSEPYFSLCQNFSRFYTCWLLDLSITFPIAGVCADRRCDRGDDSASMVLFYLCELSLRCVLGPFSYTLCCCCNTAWKASLWRVLAMRAFATYSQSTKWPDWCWKSTWLGH